MTESPMYSEEYQVKVLSYMLSNHTFGSVAKEAIQPEHFANRALQWYFRTISEKDLTPSLLREELLKAAKTKAIKESEVDKVVSYYSYITKPVAPVEEEHIKETFTKFVRTQAMKQAVLNSLDLIKAEQWDEVVSNIEAARNTGIDILNAGTDYFTEFENRIATRLAREDDRKLSTGIPELDALTNGGLKTKQLGLVIGGTGRGKSIFLEWLARIAVLLGQQVVYYTLELSAEDIADRFDSLFCHVKPQELRSMNQEVYKQLHAYHAKYGNNLIIKEYPEDEASINTIKAHYKQLNAIGVTPGLVIIDYIDLMKPHRNYNDVNQEQAAVVKAVRGFAKQYNTRVWSGLQLNRAGMAMETADETGVAGGISRLYTTDLAVVLAQTKAEAEDREMRLVLLKNRNGQAMRSIRISTDFAHMTFYSSTLKETAFESGTSKAAASEIDNFSQHEELAHVPGDLLTGAVVLD